jgi:hypothetical protein
VVDPVGLLLFEIVREHRLGRLLFQVEVGRDGVGDAGHAVLEDLPPPVDHAAPRVERGPVGLDRSPDFSPEALQVLEQGLDVAAEERDDLQLIARSQAALGPGCVLIEPVEELVERRQGPSPVGGVDDVAG